MMRWPTWCNIDKTMELYEVNENKVLDILSEVTAAKRVASMVS
jgi:ATP-dependent RNA helicase DDX49/DBP8